MDFLISDDFWGGMQAFLTCVGLFVAVYWFRKTRRRFPRATVEHNIQHWLAESDGERELLLRVVIIVENKGEVLLRLCRATIRVHQVLPISDAVREQLPKIRTASTGKAIRLEWTPYYEQSVDWPLMYDNYRELEPGETDEFTFHFPIRSNIASVIVYSFIENEFKGYSAVGWRLWRHISDRKERKREFGWEKTSVYVIQQT